MARPRQVTWLIAGPLLPIGQTSGREGSRSGPHREPTINVARPDHRFYEPKTQILGYPYLPLLQGAVESANRSRPRRDSSQKIMRCSNAWRL